MPINPAFIDVDFTKCHQYVAGYKPDKPGTDKMFASYGDAVDLIPESQWRELSEAIKAAGGGVSSLCTETKNQSSEGSCVGNATTMQHQICQAKICGKDKVVILSAMSLYQRIGSGPNSGAMISDAMDEMLATGAIPEDNPENRAKFGDIVMPPTGWRSRRPSGWEPVAKQFRHGETYIIRNRQEMFTALLRQDPVVVGRAGHSICYCDLIWEGGRWLAKYKNSWGPWGDNGFGYDSERLISSSSSWAFALRSIIHQN